MAVLITNGNGNISDVNRFYNCTDYNFTAHNSSDLPLSSVRSTPTLTGWTGTGKMAGILIAISIDQPTYNDDLKFDLMEDTGSGFTSVASVTVPKASFITDQTESDSNIDNSEWYVLAELTTPYTFVSGASYRWDISQVNGSNNSYRAKTSNGSSIFFVCWENVQATFANNDAIVVKDTLTIDQDITVQGIYGTGETTEANGIIIAQKGAELNVDTTASRTITMAKPATGTGGTWISVGGFATWRVGTSASKVPVANKIIFEWDTSNGNGTSGFCNIDHSAYWHTSAGIFQFHGDTYTNRYVRLSSDCLIGATSCVVDTDVSAEWQVGDRIVIGKADRISSYDYQVHTITSISGTTINFTPSIATYNRLSGGHVANMDAYSIVFRRTSASPSSNRYSFFIQTPKDGHFEGILFDDIKSSRIHAQSSPLFDVAQTSEMQFTKNFFYKDLTDSQVGWTMQRHGVNINDNCILVYNTYFTKVTSARAKLTCTNNIILTIHQAGLELGTTTGVAPEIVFNNNYCYNGLGNESSGHGWLYLRGSDVTCDNNYFWGCDIGLGIQNVALLRGSGNIYNGCEATISAREALIDGILTNETFGDEKANTYLYSASISALGTHILEIAEPNQSVDFSTNSLNVPGQITSLSHLKISTNGGVADDDRNVFKYGELRKSKASFSSPYNVVRTSGGNAWAVTPTSTDGTTLFEWPLSGNKRNVPTGNIQNKTMTVSIWVKINSANYYAGTHTKPTLVVDYDNGTEVSAVATATTNWQQLGVIFTPTTTFGQIKWYIKAGTDASGNDRIFYIDDMNVLYPGGEVINLSSLDLSGNAEPIFPPITTLPSAGNLWDESTDAHNISGSYGALAKKWLTLGKFLGLK